MRLVPKSFSINLPWGIGGVSLDISEAAERAAWSLYVELNTRIATKALAPGEGSIREALSSLHSLFGIVRDVLKTAGVDVAASRKGHESLGSISMDLLNNVVRPQLVRWHTSLSNHEAQTWLGMIENGKPVPNHPDLAGALVDEATWEGYATFYAELEKLQTNLRGYVAILGALAGVAESTHVTPNPDQEGG